MQLIDLLVDDDDERWCQLHHASPFCTFFEITNTKKLKANTTIHHFPSLHTNTTLNSYKWRCHNPGSNWNQASSCQDFGWIGSDSRWVRWWWYDQCCHPCCRIDEGTFPPMHNDHHDDDYVLCIILYFVDVIDFHICMWGDLCTLWLMTIRF